MGFRGFGVKDVRTGTNFPAGKLGEKVFSENITIRDDVKNEDTMPLYFDFEGYVPALKIEDFHFTGKTE